MLLKSILSKGIALLVIGLAPKPVWSADKEKMNILFITVDDLRPELKCYGATFMYTPNIDQLAAEGMLFKRAYVQQAICMATRASVMSGIRPENKRLYSCGSLQELAPETVTLTEHFARNGYLLQGIGKVYHYPEDHLEQFGAHYYNPKDQYPDRGYMTDEARAEAAANGKFQAIKKGRGPAYEMSDVEDNSYIDGGNADFAIEKLKEFSQQDEPFFMAFGLQKPHLPWTSPRKYWDMYDVRDIGLSAAADSTENVTPYSLINWGELRSYFGIPQGNDPIADELAIQLRHAYYASVSYADAQLGRVLDALDELGLKENTIIVLWGDHGWKLGDHLSWCKHSTYEIDTRVPFIISVPGMKNRGRETLSFAEMVDIYPTLCELAGISAPPHLEGNSLVPILEDPKQQIKDAAFSIYPRSDREIPGRNLYDFSEPGRVVIGYSMRTEKYRYTEWIHIESGKTLAMELYDHTIDSLENHNVANDKASEALIGQLSSRLHSHYDSSIPGILP
jgi:arylsulfatase A-like enzyme